MQHKTFNPNVQCEYHFTEPYYNKNMEMVFAKQLYSDRSTTYRFMKWHVKSHIPEEFHERLVFSKQDVIGPMLDSMPKFVMSWVYKPEMKGLN